MPLRVYCERCETKREMVLCKVECYRTRRLEKEKTSNNVSFTSELWNMCSDAMKSQGMVYSECQTANKTVIHGEGEN